MKKLLAVAIVVGLYVPSFGSVLVYKVSESLKGYQFTWKSESFVKDVNYVTPEPNDANAAEPLHGSSSKLESAKAESVKFAGYLVIDVNTGSTLMNDPNTGVALILLDKILKTYTVMRTVADANGNADPNFGNAQASLFPTAVLDKKGVVTKQEAALLDCSVFIEAGSTSDVNDPNKGKGTSNDHSSLVWNLNSMIGKLSLVDIAGDKVKINVPRSLKGQGSSNKIQESIATAVKRLNPHVKVTTDSDNSIEDDVFAGTTITLDTKLTRTANSQKFTFNAAVADIIAQLKSRGYVQAAFK